MIPRRPNTHKDKPRDHGRYASLSRTGHVDHERSCGGKLRYDTKGLANRVRKKAARRCGEPMSVYYCLVCGGFHICRRKNYRKEGEE